MNVLIAYLFFYCEINELMSNCFYKLVLYRLIMDVPEASHSQEAPADSVNSSHESSVSLTPHMLAKIERNRQRALMLRQARLASRPSSAIEGMHFTYLRLWT